MLGIGLWKHLENRKLKRSLQSETNRANSCDGTITNLLRRLDIYKENLTRERQTNYTLNEILVDYKMKDQKIRRENFELRNQLGLIKFCEAVNLKNNFEVDPENEIIGSDEEF
jgi:hypothetical protein